MNKLFVVVIIFLLGINTAFAWKSWKKEAAGALCSFPSKQRIDAAPFFLPGAVSLIK